ncbi:TonB-dependent receptor [Flavobacterium ranwuense]|uniref:TonB-dependent receptor n=1 Tax=Flavobacterium ranwuense TaxID=2541725 RepID=A0ABY2DR99_9FLAO|nr:TonB-dependent receptor [Flavobacterium ranwuense]TDE29290.1 TonB-dependent receptor [Flavobacterium ranwuense]
MKKYIFIVGLLFPCGLLAQTILGKVTNDKKEPLIGANVYWLGQTTGTSTADKGEFEITSKDISNKKLIASFEGHSSDTIKITNQTFVVFKLKKENILNEVVIKKNRDKVTLSNLIAIKTEIITQKELGKAACCDLAGCFETQTTVQPQTTNVITNSKELRILGLSGVYNQVLIDGFPMIQGLSYTYGISGIPGTLVDNIYVSKGANSVLQGYESISGQINVETKDPDNTDKLLLNVYMNNFEEKHFNANYALKKGKWSNLTAFHTVQPANKIDRDKDNFLDLPLLTRYMISNKWKYGNDKDWGWSSRVGLRFLNEKRIGGQTFYNPDIDQGSTSIYGQTVNINQPEIWAKTAYRFNDNHRITLFVSSFHQDQKSFFGTVKYNAQQTNFYGNLQYELGYSQRHSLKTGISYRLLNLNEDIAFTDTSLQRTYAGNYKKVENIPGVFAENSMSFFNDKLTWIAGIRGDQHNQFGFTLTPRTLLKYDVSPKTVFRASIGTGWRTVNLFSENIGLLVSSRDIVFSEQLRPERATNFGINLTQKFESNNLSGYISADFYRTNFQNQIFPDYDSDPTKAIIKNFTSTSISNGFQTELYLKIWNRFEFKVGYNFLDVYREVNGGKQFLPFNPAHKVLTTYSYKPLTNKFHFDVNIHWYGEQRLPNTKSNPIEFQRPDFSQPYTLVNAQFTYIFKKVEVYTGCENIFDFRQKQPIISWQDPFGQYFDTSSVWGPTRGREIYVGIRFKLINE